MQTQTSNTLHNAIMEAGSKDRPPMLAPGNYVKWKSRIKRYIDTKPNHELIHYCLKNPLYELGWKDKEVPTSEGSLVTRTERVNETYKNVSQDIRDQLNAKAEAVQIILTGIDNDIYSTVDACPNACEMWKAIERLKQGESINVQDLETNLYWEFGKFTSQDGESLESHYSGFYKMMNELIRNQNRGKAIINSPQPIYDQEPTMATQDDETSKDKEIDKLMALISLSFKKIYKPTNNNFRTSSNTSRANQDNSLRINRKQADWRDDTDDDELKDRELEAHYMYMTQLQEVSPDVADSGPIFDDEPLQNLIEIVIFIVDSGCSKHMTRNLKFLINFVEKFLGMIKLHQFMDMEIWFKELKSTCFIRDLKGNDLLTASSSQAWLWHRRLSHLNFDTINLLSNNDIVVSLPKLKFVKDHLCSSCELGKAKRSDLMDLYLKIRN
nr:integrase, catalytic region, zinc finger, CCHC-type, peptidase aspartic, catalytic [Tanacetum cinerariifolium]